MFPAGLAPGGPGSGQVGLSRHRALYQGQADTPSVYCCISCLPRQGFEPISLPPRSAASSSSFPVHYGVAVGKTEPLNKVKALPEVVEGSSEDEEEEVDHELVEKKVQDTSGDNSLVVPHRPGQVLMETGEISGCSQGLGHHWLLLGDGNITRHSRAWG